MAMSIRIKLLIRVLLTINNIKRLILCFGLNKGIIRLYDRQCDRESRIQTKYIRKDFNAAHQVCFANLRTLRGKPRGVLTRVISPKTKDTLCGVLDLVEKG